MPDKNLPPFGIRGLCLPDKPFSVLQISEKQYDSSLLSYPDSALTWLDEDDGELVTIGSGLELKQRLKDPIPHTNPRVTYHDRSSRRSSGSIEDRYIHLFDISGSQTSLDVWREHEAYYSKTQSSPSESVVSISKTDATSSQDVKTGGGSISDFEIVSEQAQSTSEVSQQSEGEEQSKETSTTIDAPSQPQHTAPLKSFGFQLDHLAGFLQGTSEVLRKAAAKTRDYDTSPIEDILSGMTTVLGEVGAFGLDVIDKLNETTITTETPSAIDVAATTETPVNSDDLSDMDQSLTAITDNYLKTANDYFKNSDRPDRAPMPHLHNGADNLGTIYDDLLKNRHLLLQFEAIRNRRPIVEVWKPSECLQLQDVEHEALLQLLAINRLETHRLLAEQGSPCIDTEDPQKTELARRRTIVFALLSRVHMVHISPNILAQRKRPPSDQALSGDASYSSTTSAQPPILDQEPDAIDAAFSARYPPLMSLRKAKTFDVLRPETMEETTVNSTVAFKQAHTGPPRPQVFDAETQRRRDFAKVCFPTQVYTPGLGATTVPLAQPKNSVCVTSAELSPPQAMSNDVSNVHSWDFAEVLDGSPNTLSRTKSNETCPSSNSFQTATSTSNDHPTAEDPAAAWLKTIIDQHNAPLKDSLEPVHEAAVESKGYRFSGHGNLDASNPAINNRLNRHRSLMNPGSRKPVPNGLHRSQTVTATNPSARLTGPFSPLFPAPVAPQSFSSQQFVPFANYLNTIAGKVNEQQQINPFNLQAPPGFSQPVVGQQQLPPKPVTGPVRSLNRSASERRPRSLYEPYRSSNSHRAFEPVWEGQDEPAKETDPNPGVVIVDASNFEPGTSEQDIRDLLADDCRTVIGINTLISCRIIATEPKVLAKLVIKDKTNADAVIGKYNNRWVKGRSLKFEYASTGIDARINRIRGALPPLDLPQPRHLRSVPDLRKATKPPFPTFVNGPKPITTPSPTQKSKPSMPPTLLPSQPVLPPAFAGNLIHECETQLKQMGYGELDPALLSRLHMYACAAKGDVHEAIEMIEDDRKANDFDAFQKKVQLAREERWGKHRDTEADGNADTSDDEAYKEELEEAIKLSMKEQ